MIKQVDLNCDMAELIPGQTRNLDAEIMPYISSCNVCCGFHSGNPEIIEATIRSAVEHKVAIGAHPSYDDRENFGRKSISIPIEKLVPQLRYQIYVVKGITESFGLTLHHIKAHGALYNDMHRDEELAQAFVSLVRDIDPQLKIYGLAHSKLADICLEKGIPFVNEVFADRRYDQIDQLRSRTKVDAVIHQTEEVLEQVTDFVNGHLKINGETHDIKAETICLHSDTQNAVALSKNIYNHLNGMNVNVTALR